MAIANALQNSFIVQERVAIEKKLFPVFAEKVTIEELFVDFDPFLFLNKVEGGLVRLSSSSLVNVTQGGGQTALIVLEDI
jgi:diaminopimelate epimerase